MDRLFQLKRKAERLARGEIRLRAMMAPRARAPSLIAHIAYQLKRVAALKQITARDRPALCLLGVLVAIWMWRAARRAAAGAQA